MRARIAVAALIDDEGFAQRRHVDLVGAEQIDGIEVAAPRGIHHARDIEPALARHEAEIEAGDPRGRGVKHVESVPAIPHDAE